MEKMERGVRDRAPPSIVCYVKSRESINRGTGGCPDGASFEEKNSSLCMCGWNGMEWLDFLPSRVFSLDQSLHFMDHHQVLLPAPSNMMGWFGSFKWSTLSFYLYFLFENCDDGWFQNTLFHPSTQIWMCVTPFLKSIIIAQNMRFFEETGEEKMYFNLNRPKPSYG